MVKYNHIFLHIRQVNVTMENSIFVVTGGISIITFKTFLIQHRILHLVTYKYWCKNVK